MNGRTAGLVVAMLLTGALPLLSQTSSAAKQGLFVPAPAPQDRGNQSDLDRAEAVRFVRVNLDVFMGPDRRPDGASPLELNLDLLRASDGRMPVAAPHTVEVLASGRIAWTGTLAGVELSAVTFVIDRAAGTLTGSISYPGGSYRIESIGGAVHRILKLDPAKFKGDASYSYRNATIGSTLAARRAGR